MNSKLSTSVLFLFVLMALLCNLSCDRGPKTVDGLKEKIRLLQEEISRLNQDIEKKDGIHKADVQKLQAQHQTEVDTLNERLEELKKINNKNHTEEIERLKELQAKELESIKNSYTLKINGKQEEINKLQEEINKLTDKIHTFEKSGQIDQMTQNMINRLPARYNSYLWTCAVVFIVLTFCLLVILSWFIMKYYSLKNQLLSNINSNIQQLKEYE